jgi:hypothetical protein
LDANADTLVVMVVSAVLGREPLLKAAVIFDPAILGG